jgi:hypothetical protein
MSTKMLFSMDYKKIDQLTEYIVLFFVALGLLFLYAQPESIMLGFWISGTIAVLTAGVAIYNDIRHKKYDRLIRRGVSLGLIILLTIAYFLFIG